MQPSTTTDQSETLWSDTEFQRTPNVGPNAEGLLCLGRGGFGLMSSFLPLVWRRCGEVAHWLPGSIYIQHGCSAPYLPNTAEVSCISYQNIMKEIFFTFNLISLLFLYQFSLYSVYFHIDVYQDMVKFYLNVVF